MRISTLGTILKTLASLLFKKCGRKSLEGLTQCGSPSRRNDFSSLLIGNMLQISIKNLVIYGSWSSHQFHGRIQDSYLPSWLHTPCTKYYDCRVKIGSYFPVCNTSCRDSHQSSPYLLAAAYWLFLICWSDRCKWWLSPISHVINVKLSTHLRVLLRGRSFATCHLWSHSLRCRSYCWRKLSYSACHSYVCRLAGNCFPSCGRMNTFVCLSSRQGVFLGSAEGSSCLLGPGHWRGFYYSLVQCLHRY